MGEQAMVLFPTDVKRMAGVYQRVRLNLSDGHVLRSAINRYFVAQDSGTRQWRRKQHMSVQHIEQRMVLPPECTSCGNQAVEDRPACHICRGVVCKGCACRDHQGTLYCLDCVVRAGPQPWGLGGRFG